MKKIIAFVLFAIVIIFVVNIGKGGKVTPADYMKQVKQNNVTNNLLHQTLTHSEHRKYYNIKNSVVNGNPQGFQYLQ